MKRTLTFVALISVVFFISCKKEIGKGPVVTEARTLTGFNKISLSVPADLVYEQSNSFFFEIKGQQNILDLVTTTIVNNELRIRFKNNVRVKNYEHLVIKTYSPDMESLELSGSGKIDAPATITSAKMRIATSGSGSINIDSLKTGSIESSISGSGKVRVRKGSGTNATLHVSGSGDIEMQHVETQTTDANINGSGTIKISVLQHLDARISGSGHIYYKGSPSLNTHTSGSGSIIKL